MNDPLSSSAGSGQQTAGAPAAAASAPPSADEVAAGAALFAGTVRFRNGGPACSTCHTAAGLPFPYGGSMGPDLTNEYSKLGPEGLAVALDTLAFPTMDALFGKRPLTETEQKQLLAFLQASDGQPPPPSPTPAMLGVSVAVTLGLLFGVWMASGRQSVKSVRRALLAEASRRALGRVGPQ